MIKHAIVTGCAGFIGSNLTDRLLEAGYQVTGIDNYSTGHPKFISNALKSDLFTFVECDLLDKERLNGIFKGKDFVFHLAANADVRFGVNHPGKDLEQNTVVTFNVLEAMRLNGISRIAFSSTGSIYGEAEVVPTPENAPMPIQTSLYGASKLACEGMISAYCEGFGFQAWIFRFVSILGERYTHGHVFDFYKQLLNDATRLTVLGNGRQRKSYLYVQDCIDAIFMAIKVATEKVNILNLGTDAYCQVVDSIGWITEHLKLNPELNFTGGERGWIGDNPFIYLECSKMRKLGWMPKLSIEQAVKKTIAFLEDNQWVLNRE